MTTLTAVCSGIKCDACAGAISRSLGRLQGVDRVTVDVGSRKIEITYDSTIATSAGILERLAAAGFESIAVAPGAK